MVFKCLGFDIKVWPHQGIYSADDTNWPQDEDVYSETVEKFNLHENQFQLLDIDSNKLPEVIQFISSKENSNLIGLTFPVDIVDYHMKKYGFEYSDIELDEKYFACLGIDVLDFNGFFSVLGHPLIKEKYGNGIDCNDYVGALELVQTANFIERQHSPHVMSKIFSLKK